MTQHRAPRWTVDQGHIYPPRTFLQPSWDVKLRYQASFWFTIGLLVIGLVLNPVVGPVVRWWQHR